MATNQNRISTLIYRLLILFCLANGLVACTPRLQETATPTVTDEIEALSFETIDLQEAPHTGRQQYRSQEPGVVIISQLDDIHIMDGWISIKSVDKLQSTDFDEHFVLAAFYGEKGGTGYNIQVVRVVRIKNTVNIDALFTEPLPDLEIPAVYTSPYHLIKIQKSGAWGEEITFNLYSGEMLVASVIEEIP